VEDADQITALASRQSGKSETICNTVAVAMAMLPRLAKIFPKQLGKFKDGLKVGVFAPIELQADTLFGRIIDRLTSDRALEIWADQDFDERVEGRSSKIRMRCGSTADKMTANPRAKIESKTYHLILIDEAQDCDDFIVAKSIMPMRTATAGTVIKTGTPTTRKGDFYKQIQINKRKQISGGRRNSKQSHFEWDWHDVVKVSPQYAKSIRDEIERLGEDSDEFRMSYCNQWMLDRGMFTTEDRLTELGDNSVQELVKAWRMSPVVVGIDPARSLDSTVVTVVWVDWQKRDAFGMYPHRVLNWLELTGIPWEEQYAQIVRFLEPYNIWAVAVDAQGSGGPVAERLALLLSHKNCDVIPMKSNRPEQTKRWNHLIQLMNRGLVSWPAGARVRRLRTWKRFTQQMADAEMKHEGPNIIVAAPNEAHAHDDYVDSLALAVYCTLDDANTMGTVEEIHLDLFG
jgi:hypothetical protein